MKVFHIKTKLLGVIHVSIVFINAEYYSINSSTFYFRGRGEFGVLNGPFRTLRAHFTICLG